MFRCFSIQPSIFTGTGSLTVLKRANSKSKVTSTTSSRTSSVVSTESDSYADVDLGTEKLPAIDTPEASHVCSIRYTFYFCLPANKV